MSEDINVGAITEALNDKMDRNANNIESPKLPIFLVDIQYPTAENNYTWYRKYSDGWVEQGGIYDFGSDQTASGSAINISLIIEMADKNYYKNIVNCGNTNGSGYMGYISVNEKDCTTTNLVGYFKKAETSYRYFSWEVKGMAA